MAKATTPQVVTSYLNELDKALVGVADEVHREIVAGVREELQGMDAAAAAARIDELGDPQFIAAEARAETPATTTVAAPSELHWYPLLAALLIMFGGLLVPFIGYLAGFVMMWTSRAWSRAEKWVATLTPVAPVLFLTLLVTFTTMQPTSSGDNGGNSNGFYAPQDSDFPNPLIPAFYDILWSALPLTIGVQIIVGAWLLWRAKRRLSASA